MKDSKCQSPEDTLTQKAVAAYAASTHRLEMQKKVAQEFADKVSKIPGVMGIVATPYEHLLHIWTCLKYRIPREQEYAVYDAEGEIFDKYDHQLSLDFESMSIASTEGLKDFLSDGRSYIVYQREGDDVCSTGASTSG